MADVQAWANQIAQQLFDGPQDLANEAAANVTDASGLAFFVGKPNGSSGQWTLKKLTPTELGKLVYNYLTTQSIAQQFASVLGVADIHTFGLNKGEKSSAKEYVSPGILYIIDSNNMNTLQILFLRGANEAVYDIYKGSENTFTVTTQSGSFYVQNTSNVGSFICYRFYQMFR